MISKIIQKEKDRQEEYLNIAAVSFPLDRAYTRESMKSHKQSLINLKEYMEDELLPFIRMLSADRFVHHYEMNSRYNIYSCFVFSNRITQIKEDIKELIKMIGRYE